LPAFLAPMPPQIKNDEERVNALKIIVCTKAVPGYINDPQISEGMDRVVYEAGSIVMNESDEYALEEAAGLKKKYGGEITVITAGSLSSQKALQVGLAKDADKAMRIDANLFDPARVTRMLARAIGRVEYDLVLTGVESRDSMMAQVGISLAEMLGLPCAYAVIQVEQGESPGSVKVTKELGYGVKGVEEIKLPALLCIQTGTTPPGFVPFRKMALAQSKPINTLNIGDLGLAEDFREPSLLKILEVFSPKEAGKAEIITGNANEVASAFMAKIKEVI
jgi:electron transfer flavoprotein beta subunit